MSECDKYLAEIRNEVETAKFTLAELDEEEHSLERLRRWHRLLRLRDVFGADSAAAAESALRDCGQALDDYAERVYRAVGGA